VRCTPGAGFARADLHRPGPHVGATNYKGKTSSQLDPRDRTYGGAQCSMDWVVAFLPP
jgi:hypothetical protein